VKTVAGRAADPGGGVGVAPGHSTRGKSREEEAGPMKRIVTWRTVVPALAVFSLVAVSAEALEKERGNIISTNWQKMEIELKSPQGRTKTWRVARDCEVKFTDKKDQFPNPKLGDLRPPMYVHFLVEPSTQVIQSIEVVEVGFEPSKGGPGTSQKGVVTNLSLEKGHLQIDLGAGPQTFQVDPKDQLSGLKVGDKVTVLIENRNGRDVITKITR
jgi:hypothetical protein